MNRMKILGAVGVITAILAISVGAYYYQKNLDSTGSDDASNNTNVEPNTPSSGVDPSEGEEVPASITEKSEKDVSITLNGFTRGVRVTSPLEVVGSVPGSWSHEGQFTIRLLNSNSEVLAEAEAELDGDWMTDEDVQFKATLEFDNQPEGVGILVLERANPSGLEENADSLTLPISF